MLVFLRGGGTTDDVNNMSRLGLQWQFGNFFRALFGQLADSVNGENIYFIKKWEFGLNIILLKE